MRRIARDYLPFVIFAPLLGVFAFAFDCIYIGATWARDMRNLMLLSLSSSLARGLRCGRSAMPDYGRFLVHYAARGGLQALRYPALSRKSLVCRWGNRLAAGSLRRNLEARSRAAYWLQGGRPSN